ncbi:MAG: chromosomal replication initiator DnaA [Rhodobacterales bacterium]|nr:chromosomal replication initiator DnaA [Rhodobacterales bacterium]
MNAERQFSFDFDHRPALARDDFLVAPNNADAVAWLDRHPHWPAPALVVHGPAACGKTHLAQVFKAATGARTVTPEGLADTPPQVLLGTTPACVVEDVEDVIAEGLEEALLHLYNVVAETGRHLLLTARSPASRWPMTLPDLASRLKAAGSVAIGPPDDSLIVAVMVKLFADRQLRVDDDVVAFILPRLERTFAAVNRFVADLDRAAMAQRRKITIPLARQVLARLDPPADA